MPCGVGDSGPVLKQFPACGRSLRVFRGRAMHAVHARPPRAAPRKRSGPALRFRPMSVPRFEFVFTSMPLALEASARLGNSSRAAGEPPTSQPAIGRHIRSLEGTLGITVFQGAGPGSPPLACGWFRSPPLSAAEQSPRGRA